PRRSDLRLRWASRQNWRLGATSMRVSSKLGNVFMLRAPTAIVARRATALIAAMLISLGASAVGWAVAEEPSAAPAAGESEVYLVEIADVTAKVGEPAVIRATLKARD